MDDPDSLFRAADMRLERAVSTIGNLLADCDPAVAEGVQIAVGRLVSAANTIAAALRASPPSAENIERASDRLWRIGEAFGIITDEARR